MKKILIILSILFCIASISYAIAIKTGSLTALNTSTYTAITNSSVTCSGFCIGTDDKTAFYYSYDAAGTVEIPISDEIEFICFPNTVEAGEVALYMKASTGTPNGIFQPGK